MTEPEKKDRSWLYVGITGAIFWAVYLTFFNPGGRGGMSAPSLQAPDLPAPADYSWTLHDLEGKVVPFSEFQDKPVVLNIWATWCPPCRAEMPSLVKLAANPELKGVAFVGVTNEQATTGVKKYASEQMGGIRVLRATDVPAVFSTDGIPATFIIAPDGKVVSKEVGAANWDDPSVIEFLKKLVKPSAKL